MVEPSFKKTDDELRNDLSGFGMTKSGFHIPKLAASFKWLKDDATRNLSDSMRTIDRVATHKYEQTDRKQWVFKKWLLDNGAIFEDAIQYPALFEGGLSGLAAKKKLEPYKAFIFIPNTLILSVERVKKSAL